MKQKPRFLRGFSKASIIKIENEGIGCHQTLNELHNLKNPRSQAISDLKSLGQEKSIRVLMDLWMHRRRRRAKRGRRTKDLIRKPKCRLAPRIVLEGTNRVNAPKQRTNREIGQNDHFSKRALCLPPPPPPMTIFGAQKHTPANAKVIVPRHFQQPFILLPI